MQPLFGCDTRRCLDILRDDVNPLTAAICCFGLSGVFAWVSAAAFSSTLPIRASATATGAVLMLREGVPDTGLMDFAMFVSAVLLMIGIPCVIAAMLPAKAQPATKQLGSLQTGKSIPEPAGKVTAAQPRRLPVVQVPSDQINSHVQLFWNPEFSPEQKQRLAAIREAIADVYPISQADWEEGFRKDAVPEREITLWEHVAKFYTYFANKRVPSVEGRDELLMFLFQCAAGYKAGHAAEKQLKHIEPELANTILGCYLFDTFSLDDPVTYPPEQLAEDEDPRPWLSG